MTIGFAVPRRGFKATIFLCPSPLSPPLHPRLLFKEVGYLEATTEDRQQFRPVQLGSPKKHQVLQALFVSNPFFPREATSRESSGLPTTPRGQEFARFPEHGRSKYVIPREY